MADDNNTYRRGFFSGTRATKPDVETNRQLRDAVNTFKDTRRKIRTKQVSDAASTPMGQDLRKQTIHRNEKTGEETVVSDERMGPSGKFEPVKKDDEEY